METPELSLDDLTVESFPLTDETDGKTLWAIRTIIGGNCNPTYYGQHSCNDTDSCTFTCGGTCPDQTCGFCPI
jgi:hypothetical protein